MSNLENRVSHITKEAMDKSALDLDEIKKGLKDFIKNNPWVGAGAVLGGGAGVLSGLGSNYRSFGGAAKSLLGRGLTGSALGAGAGYTVPRMASYLAQVGEEGESIVDQELPKSREERDEMMTDKEKSRREKIINESRNGVAPSELWHYLQDDMDKDISSSELKDLVVSKYNLPADVADPLVRAANDWELNHPVLDYLALARDRTGRGLSRLNNGRWDRMGRSFRQSMVDMGDVVTLGLLND